MTSAQALIDLYEPLIEETQTRLVRSTRLEIIERTPSLQDPLSGIGVPGTLTIFITRKGSGRLDEVKAAVKEGGERASDLVKNLYSQTATRRGISIEVVRTIIRGINNGGQVSKLIDDLRNRPIVSKEASLEEVAQQIIAQPVFGHIQYGSSVLAQYVFVPEGTDIYVMTLPYSGGRLAREGFKLVERYKEGSDAALEALVVRANPFLTTAEKAALSQVPSENHVGPDVWCRTTAWGIAAGAAGVGVAAAAAYGTACPEAAVAGAAAADAVYNYGAGDIVKPEVFSTHLSEEEIQKLGPMASVREMMQMRRDSLLANPKMKYRNLG